MKTLSNKQKILAWIEVLNVKSENNPNFHELMNEYIKCGITYAMEYY